MAKARRIEMRVVRPSCGTSLRDAAPWLEGPLPAAVGAPVGSVGFRADVILTGIDAATEDRIGKLFHDLRRTAIRDMVRAGVPQSVAMRISGHQTTAVFIRYDITSEDDKLDALAKVKAHRDAQPATPAKVTEGDFGKSAAK